MKDRSSFRVGFLASAMLASTSLSGMAGDVTTSRLLNANQEPQNWLMVNKDYAAHRYSELDQINKNNVKDLHVAFTVALGGVEGLGKVPLGGHQSTPLVDDGSMFVVDGFGAVYRIDIKDPAKARIAWIMDPGTNKADFMVPRTAASRCIRILSFPSRPIARFCGPRPIPANSSGRFNSTIPSEPIAH
jgi:alcohol dehydrogenase (cytochrome c)